MYKKKSIILCILSLVTAVTACGDVVHATENKKNEGKKIIKSISWTDYDKCLTIERGEKEKLNVTFSPTKKINKKLKWSSSKKKVVSVTKKGVIKGKKNGTATITAKTTDGSNKKVKLKVTVGKRVEDLQYTNAEKYSKMYTGQTYTLKVAFTPSNASNKKLNWISSDETVATVDSNGKVTPKENGTVVITASATDGSDVFVEQPFEIATLAKSISLSLNESDAYHVNTASHTMYAKAGTSAKLKVTFSPENTSDKRVQYESSNENVIRVDADGNLLILESGISVITATTLDGSNKSTKYTAFVNSLSKDDCTFVAHRGFSELAPGNSLSAFKLAMESNFDYIELDVWPTIDNQFVVCHDKSLKEIAGEDVNVTDLTLSAAMNYRITSGNGINTYSGEYIPSLEQVLELSKKYPSAKYYIELKAALTESQLTDLLKMIQKYDLGERVRIISFKDINLIRIRRIEEYGGDKVDLGYLTYQMDQSAINICEQTNAELCSSYNQITKDVVRIAHDKGIRVNAWTVPNMYMAGFLVDTVKVDSITANFKFFD